MSGMGGSASVVVVIVSSEVAKGVGRRVVAACTMSEWVQGAGGRSSSPSSCAWKQQEAPEATARVRAS